MSEIKPNQLELPSGKIITFNNEQFDGINKVEEWLKSNSKKFFVLAGYAGTGKTSIIKKILDKYRGGIVVSAPTHKAKKVIINTTKQEGKTLHGLLGLRPDIALENFNPNNPQFNPIAIPKITDYNLVIIDEASMINKELYDLIVEKTRFGRVKILFMGDPAQIPPVGEKTSVVFVENKNHIFHQLTKVERQNDGNPLASYYDALRNNLDKLDGGFERISNVNDLGEGITFTVNKKKFRKAVIDGFRSPEIKKDTDYCKVIAWKNNTVMMSNKVIRNVLIGKNTDIVEVGDILMGYRSISNEKQTQNIIENSADYVVIEKSKIKENTYGIKGFDVKLKETLAWGEYVYQDVFIIDVNDHQNLHVYAEMHDFFRDMAKANKRLWKKYYEFRRHNILMKTIDEYRNKQVRGNNDVIIKDMDYGYCITGHKCLSENSKVLTNNGNVLLKNIKVGDYVSIGSDKYRLVVNKFDSGIKMGYKLTTKKGYNIICSINHKIMDVHGNFKRLGDFNVGENIPVNDKEFNDEIVSIEKIGNTQMYDLEIDEIHQYVADGFIVHNSQGSTYHTVFVMENDINDNWVLKERNQIKYVALTRPSHNAVVLTNKLD